MKAALLLVAVLLCLPTAAASMTVTPNEISLNAGYFTEVEILLENPGEVAAKYGLRALGDGLVVSFEPPRVNVPADGSASVTATIRAPPWAHGDHHVAVLLLDDRTGALLDAKTVVVSVSPLLGLPPAVLAAAAIGAGAGGLGGAVAAIGLRRGWHLVGLALYTRNRRENLEKHPRRATLLDIIRRNPGILLADAQRASGLPNGPFEHHLAKLRGAGRVLVEEDGRSRRLRLAEAEPLREPVATAERVLRLVRERGPVRAADVARELELSRQALHYHVRNLAAAGLVDARIRRGRLTLQPGPRIG